MKKKGSSAKCDAELLPLLQQTVRDMETDRFLNHEEVQRKKLNPKAVFMALARTNAEKALDIDFLQRWFDRAMKRLTEDDLRRRFISKSRVKQTDDLRKTIQEMNGLGLNPA
jgi:hypothetical protein